jgi:hypothetical protein
MGDSHWVSQATGCLFAHSPAWTSRQSLFFPAVDDGHSELGTGLLLRQDTTRIHRTRLYLLDGIGLGTRWFGNLCYLLRSSGQGFPGIWVASVDLARGGDVVGNFRLGWMGECGSSHRVSTSIPSFHTRPAQAANRGDGDGMQARRSRLDLRQWLVLRGVKEQRSGSYQRHAYVVRSSRHGMLGSIPPWMAAGLLTTCKHVHLVVC